MIKEKQLNQSKRRNKMKQNNNTIQIRQVKVNKRNLLSNFTAYFIEWTKELRFTIFRTAHFSTIITNIKCYNHLILP